MLLFIGYDKFNEYSNLQHVIAIAILGLVFFFLGWLISRLIRPSGRIVQKELHDIKKELLDELNTAKKFNAEYQLLVKQETKSMTEVPEEK